MTVMFGPESRNSVLLEATVSWMQPRRHYGRSAYMFPSKKPSLLVSLGEPLD